ncbi:hypothetical protein LZ30DRAFT_692955 [Colletotrichum cereale]|nr:hypothetical protein LZ30DRAFT_692955 [Colletotrichum cereale]
MPCEQPGQFRVVVGGVEVDDELFNHARSYCRIYKDSTRRPHSASRKKSTLRNRITAQSDSSVGWSEDLKCCVDPSVVMVINRIRSQLNVMKTTSYTPNGNRPQLSKRRVRMIAEATPEMDVDRRDSFVCLLESDYIDVACQTATIEIKVFDKPTKQPLTPEDTPLVADASETLPTYSVFDVLIRLPLFQSREGTLALSTTAFCL